MEAASEPVLPSRATTGPGAYVHKNQGVCSIYMQEGAPDTPARATSQIEALTSAAIVPAPKAGWLQKPRRSKARHLFGVTDRWVVLHHGVVQQFYHEEKGPVDDGATGSSRVYSATGVRASQSRLLADHTVSIGKSGAIELRHSTQSTVRLFARIPPDRQAWIASLQKHIQYATMYRAEVVELLGPTVVSHSSTQLRGECPWCGQVAFHRRVTSHGLIQKVLVLDNII